MFKFVADGSVTISLSTSSVFNIRVDEQRVHFGVDVFHHTVETTTTPIIVPSWACLNILKNKDCPKSVV